MQVLLLMASIQLLEQLAQLHRGSSELRMTTQNRQFAYRGTVEQNFEVLTEPVSVSGEVLELLFGHPVHHGTDHRPLGRCIPRYTAVGRISQDLFLSDQAVEHLAELEEYMCYIHLLKFQKWLKVH